MVKIKEYRPLTIPRLLWNHDVMTDSYGELVAQPLESGFGITFGNALRRVLLGGIEGAAVTSVIIQGVNNEFAVVHGVVEDAMQLILNIKQIVVKSTDGKSGTMRISVNNESIVRVSDIVADSNLQLINMDHVIANVSIGGSLEIDFFVEPGRGYQSAQWPEGQKIQEDGRIYLDALFSPILNVMFDVEKTRIGDVIDYDKLLIKITTNGAEQPVDVLHYAVSVLRTQLEYFLESAEIPFNDISKPVHEDIKVQEEVVTGVSFQGIPVELLLKPIDELELSVRAHNCLMHAGILRVIDLINLSEDEGLRIKNFGKKSLTEVKDSMKMFGLSFGMNIKEDDVRNVMQEHGLEFDDSDTDDDDDND